MASISDLRSMAVIPPRRKVPSPLASLVAGAALALLVVACGTGVSTGSSSTDGDGSVAPQPAEGDGLAVRVVGPVNGELLCPGARRPCLPVEGSVEPGPDGVAWVAGRLTDGVLVVDDQRPLPEPDDRAYDNRCPDQEFPDGASMAVLEAMHEDLSQRPPGYVDLWDSDGGVVHIGITGDPAPAEAFLEEAGLADQVCLVTGFPHAVETLEAVQQQVVDAADGRGFAGFAVGRDAWEGTVTIDLPAFDQAFRAELDEISAANDGVAIIALAGVEVLGGSLEDYDAAMATVAVTPDPGQQLRATCGPVVFSEIPPDLDEFPALDEDARAALDELVSGPTGVEAAGFDEEFRWSIASRTDQELVLFGQGSNADGPTWADVRFERRDGAWRPSGWGGCRIEIGAVGLGPAEVGTDPNDPLDPGDTELALLINEQACASGRAPVDREIVPLVTETAETVTIIVLVAPVEGGAECPGNPWHPITVTLDGPLGSRQLLDGHRFPAEPIGPADLGG